MKRILTLVLALVCLTAAVFVLGACTPDQPDDPTPDVPTIDIVKNKETAYIIIRDEFANASDPNVKAAAQLRKAIEDQTGCPIGIDVDFFRGDEQKAKVEAAYEILVGKNRRTACDQIPADLGRNEYVIFATENKIVIAGGSTLAINNAVDFFLANYIRHDDASGETNLVIPEGLNLRNSFEYPEVVYIVKDFKSLSKSDASDKNLNDIVRLVVSAQGRINKEHEKNGCFVYLDHDSQDKFWLDYISGEGKLLNGYAQETISSWDEFWAVFGDFIKASGIVVWDPDVPATANVAATMCSVEGWLPVRYNTDENSLYSVLKKNEVPVKYDLCCKFTGTGTIPDTDIASSGSTKCDAYLWALDQYMDRCSSTMLAYILDGASCVPGNPIYDTAISHSPEYNQLYSHDYYILNECFFVDLTCVADEIPCDDPDQPMGTDAKTLRKIFSTMQERNNGKMTKLMGFPPWYMKYTTTGGHGKTEPVALEWMFVDVLSGYNLVKEADAAHPAWMTNASVYSQYQRAKKNYTNNKSIDDTISFNSKTRYFTIYMGDYDSSAWLKNLVPNFFKDKARGTYPLMWGFNPNLSDRVPMIFDYVYENLTINDYIVTGDSGAGYVAPSMLADIDEWVEFNEPYLDMYDMDIVGFIINTTHKMTPDIFAAYAEIAPVGSFHNDSGQRLVIYNDETVFMHLQNGIDPNASDAPNVMYAYMQTPVSNFAAFRTVVQSPSNVVHCIESFLTFANSKKDGYTYEYVDPYTLFSLALESGMGTHLYD